jgi:hypothetical protein
MQTLLEGSAITFAHEGLSVFNMQMILSCFLKKKNPELASNLKMVLTYFEQVSGMRINYDKSELIPLCVEEDELDTYVNIIGCPVGTFPIKYLGITLHYNKLRREDIQPLRD